ncbi:NAD(P)H-quinone oxidoreductase subunit F [Stenomitos frigidus]|uniref:NAD(P)H-quinone oxidoreductase subunit F n=1 Tax=Stenomitos frigidus ULC18 TaxID=2107698 RepID=A0A2T1DYD9_9CYAN|nr:NAD(P)H-quinone oxidoreductase subunit F [Stenomitos frigidus]PSB25508.1 NAD(P)H-quinone oxidoreductase subunit F [Stenomitos frigidus ULC18]
MDQFLLQSIWLVPCYALAGAVLSVLWFPSVTRLTGPRPSGYVNILTTFLAFLHGLLALPAVWNQPAQQFFFPWLNVANLDLTLPFEASALTVGATILITGLNLLAQVYAVGYLEMDWGWARFFALLALFEAGMCALVLCNSLFFSYMILEVLTLGTYLLVGLWFNQSLVVTGARDAFLTKRVGDLFLLMGVVALLPLAGTWNFTELAEWAQTADVNPTVITLVGLALIAGPMGKCAQFPLHLWLDEAMEGPLPSTILRNSVVVATGAWVLIKLEPVLALSPVVMAALVWIGGITAVGGSLIAIAQIDLKRTLSYLVSAYMGLVFIAVGAGQSEAALLLVLTHAVAIALLVMSVGSIIWNSITQDITQLGGLWSRRPVSGLAFLVGTAGLIALPPFGSFWALLKLADGLWTTQPWLVGLVLLVNGLTAFSLVRVFSRIFGGQPHPMAQRSPEIHWLMALPMAILLGVVLHVPIVLQAFSLLPAWADLNKDVALLLLWSSIFGCSLSAVVYLGSAIPKPVQFPWKPLQDLLSYDFYTAQIYRMSIVVGVDLISRITSWIDRYLVDGFVNLVGVATLFGGQGLKYSTSGQTQSYALTILVGAVLVGCLVMWSS